jgi:Holliday junction resolvase RusA-like endonuclease
MGARTFDVFVRGVAQPQGSARVFLNKKTRQPILVSKTRNVSEWRQAIKDVVAWQWEGEPIDNAVGLSLIFVFSRPKSIPKTRLFVRSRPDASKLLRAVEDALKGVAYTDDARVVAPCPVKIYGDEPGVHIFLTDLGESPADHFAFNLAHGQRVFNLLSPLERSQHGKGKGNAEEGPTTAL